MELRIAKNNQSFASMGDYRNTIILLVFVNLLATFSYNPVTAFQRPMSHWMKTVGLSKMESLSAHANQMVSPSLETGFQSFGRNNISTENPIEGTVLNASGTNTSGKLATIPEATVNGEYVNGKSVKEWTVRRSISQALHMATAEEMERDPNVFVLGEDVGHYGGSYKVTKDLHYRYGNFRVMDTPICENTFTGLGVGAAMNGLRPIVEGMNIGFLLLAFNQIANNAGMVRYTSGGAFDIPMVIRGPGGVGKQLGPEHSQRIEAYLMAIPGLKIVACSTPRNARGLLKSAIRENNPVVFFEHVLTYGITEDIPLLPYTLPLDKAEIALEGKDITILAYSKLRHVALESAKQLQKAGINPEIVDLISLKPLDIDTIKKSIKKTGRCLILDESSRTGGIGAEIFSQVVENCSSDLVDIPVRLATKDIPTPYARALEEATIVTSQDVTNMAMWMLTKGK